MKLFTRVEYINESNIDKNKIVYTPVKEFDKHCKKLSYDDKELSIIEKIDGIHCKKLDELSDEKGAIRLEKLGNEVNSEDFSSGLKAALFMYENAKKLQDGCVDVTCAGSNALREIFKIANENCVAVLLRHMDIDGVANALSDVGIEVDERRVVHGDKEFISTLYEFNLVGRAW